MPTRAFTPLDDFPPHGYLDNPFHTWKLAPHGVMRSRPPSGMGWHTPNYGSYGRNQLTHRVHLHVGMEVAGIRLLTPADFRARRVAVACDLHTSRRLRYTWTHPAGVSLAATYFVIDAWTLGCQIEVHRAAPSASGIHAAPGDPLPIRIWLAQEVAHNPATSRLWEHGLYAVAPGATDPATGPAGLQGVCPEGDAWAIGAFDALAAPLTPVAARHDAAPWDADAPLPPGRDPAGMQTATLALAYALDVPPEGPAILYAALTHDVSADGALQRWRAAAGQAAAALGGHTDEDERFWSHAPRLSGDWPAHWRRGMATDFETLRMTVRPPSGIFEQPWDGMQIQAPRLVLAEAALDALTLAWAAPALACDILTECFRSAPRPNVPCVREDGSYNMVADDGSVCGTGPEWGWPLAVADALWHRTGDERWLADIYPYAARYLGWWLASRVDGEGWLVHACSWESGQDVSARFGEQQTGGSDVRHLRPVDLQAAVAQGCSILATWAAQLGRPPDEIARWREHAREIGARLRGMWHEDWFRDYDTQLGRWSGVQDPMQLAPLACGLATPAHIAALLPAFDQLPLHGGAWPALVWPPVVHTILEAALAAQLDTVAASISASVVERAWRRMDGREVERDGGLPGVSREYWPEGGPETAAGIEGYGWGALTTHCLLRYIVGVRELSPTSLRLTPALPHRLRRPGASFSVGSLPFGDGDVTVTYQISPDGDADAVDIALDVTGTTHGLVARDPQDGRALAVSAESTSGAARIGWRWAWLKPVVVEIAAPTA